MSFLPFPHLPNNPPNLDFLFFSSDLLIMSTSILSSMGDGEADSTDDLPLKLKRMDLFEAHPCYWFRYQLFSCLYRFDFAYPGLFLFQSRRRICLI